MPRLDEVIRPQVVQLQIIIGALSAGVLTFAGVVVSMQPEAKPGPLLAWMGLGMAALGLLMYLPVGMVVRSAAAKQLNPPWEQAVGGLFQAYQTGRIVSAAILEGGAFFNLIVYMLEGQIVSLGTAGVLLVPLLLLFPTASGVANWIENSGRAIVERRG